MQEESKDIILDWLKFLVLYVQETYRKIEVFCDFWVDHRGFPKFLKNPKM